VNGRGAPDYEQCQTAVVNDNEQRFVVLIVCNVCLETATTPQRRRWWRI